MQEYKVLPEPPIWCRIILTIITVCSFLPQILLVQKTQSIQGIHPLYILWNLISATEQFTIFFFELIVAVHPSDQGGIFLHDPPSKGDWFSLCQCGIVTLPFLVLFIQVLYHSDRRVFLGSIYIIYLLISVIPLFISAASPFDNPYEVPVLQAVFYLTHSTLLWPIISILACLSIYYQACEIFKTPVPNSLSFQGLLVQAIVFLIGSVVWIWSLPFPYEEARGHWNLNIFYIWYSRVGWIVVDNLIFALGQALLCVLVSRRAPSNNEVTPSGETEPLLG